MDLERWNHTAPVPGQPPARQAAVAAYEQAEAEYRLVVLKPFENVADTLSALHNDAPALEAQQSALESASGALDLRLVQWTTCHCSPRSRAISRSGLCAPPLLATPILPLCS